VIPTLSKEDKPIDIRYNPNRILGQDQEIQPSYIELFPRGAEMPPSNSLDDIQRYIREASIKVKYENVDGQWYVVNEQIAQRSLLIFDSKKVPSDYNWEDE
jgi:hypothetical protein